VLLPLRVDKVGTQRRQSETRLFDVPPIPDVEAVGAIVETEEPFAPFGSLED
jgi:hypothetical protein